MLRTVLAYERGGAINFHHRKSPAGGRDCITLSGVRLLTNAQRIHVDLKCRSIDEFRCWEIYLVANHDRLLLFDERDSTLCVDISTHSAGSNAKAGVCEVPLGPLASQLLRLQAGRKWRLVGPFPVAGKAALKVLQLGHDASSSLC
jgi:hypothetical protein